MKIEDYSKNFHGIGKGIIDEVDNVIKNIDAKEVDTLVDEIVTAEKVFIIGVGRVFLSAQCFAKRLNHLGIETHVVGSVNEKPITNKDLLLVASGSGESIVPLVIAKKAKAFNARIGIITSARMSSIKDVSDFAVHLQCPTKTNQNMGSVQPMSTLFDQTLHIFGDTVALLIQQKKGIKNDELWKYHANLE